MWFRLASLWGCTVREAQGRCTAHEFAEWCAFYRKDPWGGERDDLRIAELSAMFANVHRKEGVPLFSVRDFMHYLPPEETKYQTVEQQVAIAEQLDRAIRARNQSI